MTLSTQTNSFLSNSSVRATDGISVVTNGSSDQTTYTTSSSSIKILPKRNISKGFNTNENIIFYHLTPRYSRLAMEEAHSSQPNYYQTTALNYKTDFRKESFDRFDLSRRTNSQQKQESSFTTVSIREPIPSGLFHEVTPATKVNLSSSVRVVSLISNEGFITNQGYPYAYEDAAYCQWSVRLANGTRIKITFEDLDVEFDKDFLEISFGQGNEYYFRRFTGNKVPPASVFNTDKIKIVFKTDRNGHGRGFYIYFKETNEGKIVYYLISKYKQ